MSILKWFRRKAPPSSIDDPIFGKLVCHKPGEWTGWWGTDPARTGRDVQLLLDAPDGKPTDAQSRNFLDFQAKYKELRPAISKALWELCESYADFFENGKPPGSDKTPEEFIDLTGLECVKIEADATVRLYYGFEVPDIWDDAMMNIVIQDGKPVPDCIDD